jgi:cytoplasmic iron level regulating protein YaaA (DUF328/UPF0246 family)
MIILLHSSKTMQPVTSKHALQTPLLLDQAVQLHDYLATLSPTQLASSMKISPVLAAKTASVIAAWSADPARQSLALDTFKGDVYSGLQAHQLTPAQRDYANKTLVILSGLYGLIRPFDGIMPYRLEMMYKFPKAPYDNLYKFWGHAVADQLPAEGLIANCSSVEYSKMVTPFVDPVRVIAPQFYTISPKTGEPTFVTVHSKIARGAFARWLITTGVNTIEDMTGFDLLGYQYNAKLSQPGRPAFVTPEFGGIGLSIRLLEKD